LKTIPADWFEVMAVDLPVNVIPEHWDLQYSILLGPEVEGGSVREMV
jgi:hypothetical protein